MKLNCLFFSLLLSLIYCSPATRSFSFTFCNDVHLGCSTNDPDLFSKALRQIESEKSDFVVIAGDLTCNGTMEEFSKMDSLLSRSRKKFRLLPGNHDIDCNNEGKKNYLSKFSDMASSYLFIHKNVCFMMLDLSDCGRAHVKIDSSHIEWITSSLKDVDPRIPIVIITHFPLNPNTPKFSVEGTADFLSALENRSLLCFLSGHYHGHFNDTTNGIPYLTNVTLMPNVENFSDDPGKGYLQVWIRDQKIITEFREIVY